MTRNGRNTSSQLLEDKVVVVTGSTRGIGRSIADACSRAGAVVVVSSRKEDAVADTVDAFAANDQRVCGMSADVSSAEDVECLFETTLGLLGRIDAWVNNAGVSLGYRPLDECSSEEIDHIVSVNLTGTMLASRLLVPYFTEHGGILLNMSGRGHRGEATPFTAAYAATKSAVASITRSVAAENKGRPISVHALVPGMVDTDFYRDLEVSPRLEHARDNWRYAMEAFGVPLEEVGERAVPILAQVPGRQTGRIYSFLGPGRMVRGVSRMMWYRATGKLPKEV